MQQSSTKGVADGMQCCFGSSPYLVCVCWYVCAGPIHEGKPGQGGLPERLGTTWQLS